MSKNMCEICGRADENFKEYFTFNKCGLCAKYSSEKLIRDLFGGKLCTDAKPKEPTHTGVLNPGMCPPY